MIRITLFIIITLLFSCKIKKEDSKMNFQHERKLTNPKKIQFPPNVLKNPVSLLVIDTILIIKDSYDNNNLTLYNLNTTQIIRTIKTGRGPKEVLKIGGLIKGNNRKEFFIYDIQRSLLLSYNIDSIYAGVTGWNKRIDLKRKKKEIVFFSICFISDYKLIGTGICKDGRYMVADLEGNILNICLDYPDFPNEQTINHIIKGFGYQCFLKSNLVNNKIVSATYNGNIIEISEFNSSNNTISLIKRVGNYMMHYEKDNRYLIKSEDPTGYVDLSVGEKYIYALYSGRSFRKYAMAVRYSKTIFVLDWNGNLIVKFNSDKELKAISISQNEDRLYAIYEDPEPHIIVYDIQKTFKSQ